jgi:hypothetical protein
MGRGNPLRGEAYFTWEGREYLLVLNNRTWIEAEEVLGGVSILDVVDELRAALEAGRNPRMKHMCAVVFGGLIQHQPEVTENLVIDMFMSGDRQFRDAVLQAMQGAQLPDDGEPDTSAVGNAPANGTTRVGTGRQSSRAGARPGSNPAASGTKHRAR